MCGGGKAFVFGRASSLGKSVLGLSGFLSERVAVGGGGQSRAKAGYNGLRGTCKRKG